MRIIGGSAGGIHLKSPRGYEVRPTPDLVRQAVFNSLGAGVLNARVLELFAGTGALSLESISRGARSAVCVEKSPKAAQIIRQNWTLCGFDPALLELRLQDAFTALHQLQAEGDRFDIIVADPPYGEKNIGHRSTSLAQRLLDDSRLPLLLTADGLFILGHARRDTLSLPELWHERKMLKHGDSMFRFLVAAAIPGAPEGPA